MASGADDGVVLGGAYRGTIDFGDNPFTNPTRGRPSSSRASTRRGLGNGPISDLGAGFAMFLASLSR